MLVKDVHGGEVLAKVLQFDLCLVHHFELLYFGCWGILLTFLILLYFVFLLGLDYEHTSL